MKKFLEELNNTSNHIYESTAIGHEAKVKYSLIEERYGHYLGLKALYKSKSMREYRIVTITEVKDHYLVVTYDYYGPDYSGTIRTCINYPSLLSGDDELEVDDIV